MPSRYRKRGGTAPQNDRSVFSTALREARNCIQKKDFAAGLTRLDTLANQTSNLRQKAKILSVIGDAYVLQCDYPQALSAYSNAESQTRDDPREWLRPCIAQVVVLLASGQYPEALAKAEGLADRAKQLAALHAQQLSQAAHLAALGIAFSTSGVPHRPSVICTRLGELFLNAGFAEEATAFYRQALEIEPNGSSRGRLGLARVAIQRGDWQDAAQQARNAITVGKFQRKTLPAIPVYLKACSAGDQAPDLATLLDGYTQKKKRVRDRAYHLCITTLRASQAPGWKQVALDWLALPGAKDNVVLCEIRKLLLAEGRLKSALPAQRTELGQNVLSTVGLRFGEWSFAARELIKANPSQALCEQLVANATERYGERLRWLALHRLARAAVEAGETNLARTWLQGALQVMPANDIAKNRATWALARLEEASGNYVGAAAAYYAIYSSQSTRERSRLPAMVAWARAAVQAGQTQELEARKDELQKALAASENYETLFDTALLVRDTPTRELNSMHSKLRDRAEKLAVRTLRNSSDPKMARRAWMKLVKRLTDFGRSAKIVEIWRDTPQAVRDRLWSQEDAYWESLGYLVRSVRKEGDVAGSITLARTWLDDPATPACGIVHLALQTGFSYLRLRDRDAAVENFMRAAKAQPSHLFASWAHYWLSLNAWAEGRYDEAADIAARLRPCLGENPRIIWQKLLRIRGMLLEKKLNLNATLTQIGSPKEPVLQAELKTIEFDLARIGS